MQDELERQHILATCASCGGDPGGLVWEGIVLTGPLTSSDITALLRGALDHRGVVRLFRTRKLRGLKLGHHWVTRASVFIEDWQRLEARTPIRRARAMRIVEVQR